MQKYKAVFSDIDGTLLNSQHQISPKTEAAIKGIIQQGIPFIPVSARPPYAITPYTEQLQSRHGMICYSGALILDSKLNALYSVIISPENLTALLQVLPQSADISVSYYSGLNWFSADTENPWIKQECAITKLAAKPLPAQLDNVHKILVMGDEQPIEQLEKALQQQFPQLSIHRSKSTYLEIMHKSATKSKAIQFMENILNVRPEEIIAFGDNFNDLDMLQYAGLSVAMGNAPDEVKKVAKMVTKSNDEEGIAEVLENIFTKQ